MQSNWTVSPILVICSGEMPKTFGVLSCASEWTAAKDERKKDGKKQKYLVQPFWIFRTTHPHTLTHKLPFQSERHTQKINEDQIYLRNYLQTLSERTKSARTNCKVLILIEKIVKIRWN